MLTIPTKFLFVIVIVFSVAATIIWAIFLRPVPIVSASGTIVKKTFKPAGTYWQYPAGLNRGFQAATPIPIAEAYVFELSLDGFERPVFFSLNTIASNSFQVGQKVAVQYKDRGIPYLSRRIYVRDMTAR